MTVTEVIVEDPRWEDADLQDVVENAVRAALGHLQMGTNVLVSVLGCDDAEIARLNQDFREKPQPTNVLSWPSENRTPTALPACDAGGPLEELGDIAIAYETCKREALDQKKAFEDHITHLIIHAFLHLLGYDHVEDDDAELMETTEIAILSQLGITDPYV